MRYVLLTIKHKWFVFLAGLQIGVPLYLLILHDWSKFTAKELPHYQRQFYGKADKPLEFSYAWLHHQKCNKHHWEYWIPITGHTRGGYSDMQPLPMPEKYIKEMVADFLGASRAYEGKWPGKTWDWWDKNRKKIETHCHAETWKRIEQILEQVQ
jgi:hypothetical protein